LGYPYPSVELSNLTCMAFVDQVAAWWGRRARQDVACNSNRTICATCDERCGGCVNQDSVCIANGDTALPVTAQVGVETKVEFCALDCFACTPICTQPGWPDGCNTTSTQSVALKNCHGNQVGSCLRSWGSGGNICGGRCGVTPECTEDVRIRNVWQLLDGCAALFGVSALGGPYPDGSVIQLPVP
jgi:hypothetical protein